jgi:hypothetical protein
MSKSFKIKSEKNEDDQDEIYILDDISPKKTNSPIHKLPHRHFAQASNEEKREKSPDSCLVKLIDYKRELFEDGDDNLLRQFSEEQDVEYDSNDDETVFHKSNVEEEAVFSCKKLNENVCEEENDDDDSCVILDDDEDVQFMKENEIILSNVTKILQEYIDLTGDDNDHDDDDDGFRSIEPVRIKQEPNVSPIVLKEKKSMPSSNTSMSKEEKPKEKSSPQSSMAPKQPLLTSYFNKPIIKRENSVSSNSSDDVRLAILASEYEKNLLEKNSTITTKRNSDANSDDSENTLFFNELKKGNIKETTSVSLQNEAEKDSNQISNTKSSSLFNHTNDNNQESAYDSSTSFSEESKLIFIFINKKYLINQNIKIMLRK